MRILSMTLAVAGTLFATTLQKLSTDDMIQKSTAIVHVKVTGTRGAFRGGTDIYTYYQLQVMESWKGLNAQPLEVAVPGGVARGLRQSVAGAPSLNVGGEYVIFLWTSPSGLTQIIGLSQGLFSVAKNEAGTALLYRPSTADLMLDQTGRVVNDPSTTIVLTDLRSQIQQALKAGK
jgi:hypothetical protein